jgi:mevalonate kinase
MKWFIPGKTFLVGEYVALTQGPAILLNTSPYFELYLTNRPLLEGLHPDCPAARWWKDNGKKDYGLLWVDPYRGIGGLGASSAQFIAAFQASSSLSPNSFTLKDLLEAYYLYSWDGKGLKPSGYDIIAQTHLQSCVYIDQNSSIQTAFSWPFEELDFILAHTGKKLATHSYLSTTPQTDSKKLSAIVYQALDAFHTHNPATFINSINSYHRELQQLGLVANHTITLIKQLQKNSAVLAAKGCGALGADVILLITKKDQLQTLTQTVKGQGLQVIASAENLIVN